MRRLRFLLKSPRLLAVTVVAAAAVVAVVLLYRSVKTTSVTITGSNRIDITPEQIAAIRDIGQWEFLSVATEEMVDTTRRGFFSDDHLVRIYYGTLRLGIDLQKAPDDWIKPQGDSLIVTLPPVTLLDSNFIDEALTRSFYESGSWTAADREALYNRARSKMIAHAMTSSNKRSAAQNATLQIRNMLKAMGFEKVVIRSAGR